MAKVAKRFETNPIQKSVLVEMASWPAERRVAEAEGSALLGELL